MKVRVGLALVVAILGLAARVGSQQSPAAQPGTVLLGKVVEGPGTTGVGEATVRLRSRGGAVSRTGFTDPLGQFVFFDIPDGQYDLEASKPGFWFGTYGQRAPQERGALFVIAAGRAPAPIVIPIWKGGVVSGAVIDDYGEPMAGCTVRVLAPFVRAGRRVWITQPLGATTDDRGRYRLSDLYPGEHLLLATPARMSFERHGRMWTYEPLLHPAASTAGATTPLATELREERPGTNFRLSAREAFAVSGRIVRLVGSGPVQVQLTRWDEEIETEIQIALIRTTPAGDFAFPAVAAGTYRVSAWNADARPQMFAVVTDEYGTTDRPSSVPSRPPDAFTRVTVTDADVSGVSVSLSALVEVMGQLIFRGAGSEKAQALRPVISVSTPRGKPVTVISADPKGEFRVSVTPGSYFIRVVNVPAGWALETLAAGGRIVTDEPIAVDEAGVRDIVVTFTDQVAEVTGVVRNSQGGPLPEDRETTAFVFPIESARWVDYGGSSPRIVNARVSPSGAFTFRGLPPGEYFAVARGTVEAGDEWQLATNLERWSKTATRLRVTAGAKTSIELRIPVAR